MLGRITGVDPLKGGFVAKVLVIEDSVEAQKLVELALKGIHELDFAASLAEARKNLREKEFDLVLLDLTLPDGDGLNLCEEVQKENSRLPIIVVSAKTSVSDRVMGLVTGADDYITKPYDSRELKARVDTVMRRTHLAPKSSQMLIGELAVDLLAQRVEAEEKPLDLTPIEYRILIALGEKMGEVLTREQIYERLWGEAVNVGQRNIDAHVSKLRRKVKDYGLSIHSKRGEGYAMTGDKLEKTVKTTSNTLPHGIQ